MCEADEDGRRSFLALPGFAIMAVGWLGWVAGRALSAAVARQREYLADARAVQFTRSRDGLGGVLRKVAGQQQAFNGRGSESFHSSVRHMLLVDPSHQPRWFDTHPPLSERIRRIYGRPMPALLTHGDDARAATRPDAIF
jgi:heat shock protein HtpX